MASAVCQYRVQHISVRLNTLMPPKPTGVEVILQPVLTTQQYLLTNKSMRNHSDINCIQHQTRLISVQYMYIGFHCYADVMSTSYRTFKPHEHPWSLNMTDSSTNLKQTHTNEIATGTKTITCSPITQSQSLRHHAVDHCGGWQVVILC